MFKKFADKVTKLSGSVYAFGLALAIIVFWAISGPFLHFSDTWQLIINTFTTLVTFLMVFLIQGAQNREQEQQKRALQSDLRHTKRILWLLEHIDKRI